MNKVRLIPVPGNEVEIGKPYVMVAIPQKVPLKPGEIPDLRNPKINMQMVPANFEIQNEEGDWEQITLDTGPKIHFTQ